MSSTFYCYLKSKSLSLDVGGLNEIGSRLRAMLDRVCQDPNTPFFCSFIGVAPGPGDVIGSDVLVYFVGGQGTSLVRKSGFNGTLSAGGYSHPSGGGWISEVYVDHALAAGWDNIWDVLARIAFHEIMHNKLEMDSSLHHHGGLASSDVSKKSLTSENIRTLAPALAKAVKQNTDYLGTSAN